MSCQSNNTATFSHATPCDYVSFGVGNVLWHVDRLTYAGLPIESTSFISPDSFSMDVGSGWLALKGYGSLLFHRE